MLDLIHRCNNLRSFKQIHALLLRSGSVLDDVIVHKISDFFQKSADLVDYACKFFNQDGSKSNLFPFNKLIATYAGSNRPQAAVLVYRRIMQYGFSLDKYSFPVVLKACTKFIGVVEGEQIHGVVVKIGFRCELYVQNSLLHFYSVSGGCVDASKVFDEMLLRDAVSWSGLISGYVSSGLFDEAISLFLKIDVKPNIAAFVSVLVACGQCRYLKMGNTMQGMIVKHGFGYSLVVSNALLDLYVKCECLSEAMQLFNEIPERDVVSWTCMISGLVQCNSSKESLELFSAMQASGVEPDKLTLTSVLSACASIGALAYGRWVHEYIDRKGIKWDSHIGTSMIDMYAKCGCVEMALETFHGMSSKNVFTWNALLAGLALHGLGHEALKYFEEMIREGTKPNEVTFLAILTACCHLGLVDEGRRHFYQMKSREHNLSPRLEHYGCMVDLLCRAGLLDEAQEIITRMPMAPDVLMWGALLSASKAQGNVRVAQDISDRFDELESQDSGVYVLLSNIYAANGRWDNVTRARKLMTEKGIRKAPGSSVIEVDGEAHEFLVEDTNHPRTQDVHVLLRVLANQVHSEAHFSRPFL